MLNCPNCQSEEWITIKSPTTTFAKCASCGYVMPCSPSTRGRWSSWCLNVRLSGIVDFAKVGEKLRYMLDREGL